jgi:pyruvate formate lyase activating enzyme
MAILRKLKSKSNLIAFIILCLAFASLILLNNPISLSSKKPREAMYYEKLSDNKIQCQLCPRRCVVPEGGRGLCRVRENRGGTYYTLIYGAPCAVQIDPIEKKPFFHVLPSSGTFSIATAGCNLKCKFCQNWEISQVKPEETINYDMSPEDVVAMAERYGCQSIAFTYSEPTIFYEYMLEIAKLAKERDIMPVYHSNGFINPEPLRELCQYLEAANIDLKSFTNEYYEDICFGKLNPVLETLKILKEQGVWLEITNLVVPTLNDDPEEIKAMCQWIKDNLGPDVPLHFSRFYPMYKLKNLPPTPIKTLEKAREIALETGLHYVYIGNVPGHEGENTYCPDCGKLLIRRFGFSILENHINNGKCEYCGQEISGVWWKTEDTQSISKYPFAIKQSFERVLIGP